MIFHKPFKKYLYSKYICCNSNFLLKNYKTKYISIKIINYQFFIFTKARNRI